MGEGSHNKKMATPALSLGEADLALISRLIETQHGSITRNDVTGATRKRGKALVERVKGFGGEKWQG